MAIKATFTNYAGTAYNNATLKIRQIWGSKSANWNAWVDVFETDQAVAPLETFSVHCQYVEGENPYVALYAELGKLSHLTNIVHDVESIQAPVPEVEIPVTKQEDVAVESIQEPIQEVELTAPKSRKKK